MVFLLYGAEENFPLSMGWYKLSFSSSGDINDEDEVLSWLNEEDTLEIPGRIEEVNIKMLEKILAENEHVVVFFCKYELNE